MEADEKSHDNDARAAVREIVTSIKHEYSKMMSNPETLITWILEDH